METTLPFYLTFMYGIELYLHVILCFIPAFVINKYELPDSVFVYFETMPCVAMLYVKSFNFHSKWQKLQ